MLTCGVCEKVCLRDWVFRWVHSPVDIGCRFGWQPYGLILLPLRCWKWNKQDWPPGEKKNREHEMETMSTVCRGLGLEMEGWNWNVSLKQERCWAVFWALKCRWARHRTPKMLTVTVQRNLFTLVTLPLGLLVHNASVKIVISQLGLIKTSFPFTSFYLKVTRSFYHLASALALWLGILL